MKGEVFTEKFNKNSIKLDLQPVPKNIRLDPITSTSMIPVNTSLIKHGMKNAAHANNLQLSLPGPNY